ncbi:MAG: DUF4238 domain-containing protein [Armatimonadota bacterium]
MAANKNHHFVPQFYLRNFGNQRTIGLYNIARGVHMPSVSIRRQCQRAHLYGPDPTLERDLSRLEALAASAVSGILSSGTPPAWGSPAYVHLVEFVALQWGRTPAAGAGLETLATDLMRALLRDKVGTVVDEFRMRTDRPEVESLLAALAGSHLLLDLQPKLLINRTDMEFITSDSPVVLRNPWCRDVRGRTTVGLASQGLQVFLPLSPSQVLILYDDAVYTVGRAGDPSVDIGTTYEVTGINRLQLLVADENLFHSGSERAARAIDELPLKRCQARSRTVRVLRTETSGSNSLRIQACGEAPNVKLDISHIRLREEAKRIPVAERAVQIREGSRLADMVWRRARGDLREVVYTTDSPVFSAKLFGTSPAPAADQEPTGPSGRHT